MPGDLAVKWITCGYFKKKTVSNLPAIELKELYALVYYDENETRGLKAIKVIGGLNRPSDEAKR